MLVFKKKWIANLMNQGILPWNNIFYTANGQNKQLVLQSDEFNEKNRKVKELELSCYPMLKQLITDITWLFKMFESGKGSRKSDKKEVIHKVQYLKNETFSIYSVKSTGKVKKDTLTLIWMGVFLPPLLVLP